MYQAAFRYLVADEVLKARLDLATLGQLIKLETAAIERFEAELGLLGGLPGRPGEVGGRVRWLLGKLGEGQRKVEGYEGESARLKGVLRGEY